MEKLTIKELAPYSPYKIQVQYLSCTTDNKKVKAFLTGLSIDDGVETTYKRKKEGISGDLIGWKGNNNIYDLDFKLILRPLSDLTKEIEVNGERFVPALRLAGISVECGIYQDIAPSIEFKYSIKNKPFGKILKVTKLDEWVIMLSFNEPERLKYIFYEKLLEWHFDTKGLIEKGLAIDINTLKQ